MICRFILPKNVGTISHFFYLCYKTSLLSHLFHNTPIVYASLSPFRPVHSWLHRQHHRAHSVWAQKETWERCGILLPLSSTQHSSNYLFCLSCSATTYACLRSTLRRVSAIRTRAYTISLIPLFLRSNARYFFLRVTPCERHKKATASKPLSFDAVVVFGAEHLSLPYSGDRVPQEKLFYCCPVNLQTAQESIPKPFRIGLRVFFFKKQAP